MARLPPIGAHVAADAYAVEAYQKAEEMKIALSARDAAWRAVKVAWIGLAVTGALSLIAIIISIIALVHSN